MSREIEVIGTRHGEKIYETLATAEELSRAEDQGEYYRVPVDARDLNYADYFEQGEVLQVSPEGYHSHNTSQLDLAAVKALLQSLPEFKGLIGGRGAHDHG